ncbi:MAG TPA: type 1 glutamine amidotransferase domain-containing protein [Alphaproteobacteria bacterium]|nr:type 1 glutamine amidotransferase domain-containing protein [Alphaproteobacteria bacterium]
MSKSLEGKKVAILATNWFEQSELTEPKTALEEAGATVDVVSPERGEIKGARHDQPGDTVCVDKPLEEARPEDYDALMLPGGVFNPDQLRTQEAVLSFVRHFFEAAKPVGAICHGPQVLISAGVVRGRTMTSYPSIRVDLSNAGAEVVDQEVVVDGNLITSRRPDDLPAFNKSLINEIGRQAQ